MKLLRTLKECREYEKALRSKRRTLGFVPTMGALHEGHASLIARARKECDAVVLSIFVNPTQFNDPNDLKKYPRTLKADLAIAQKMGADAVFVPTAKTLYPDGYRYRVTENEFSQALCGAHRPGHFDGVLTVVLKLFQIVRPDRAYFGEKDHQQMTLIQGMIDAFFMPIELVPCSTVREKDGLAMSSRNVRLTPSERETAALFPKVLKSPISVAAMREKLARSGFRVDYVEKRGHRVYGAVHLGEVRLIDNVPVRKEPLKRKSLGGAS